MVDLMLTPDPELAMEYGLFSVRQARAAGISRAELVSGLRRGRWERRGRGVLTLVGREPQRGDDLLVSLLTATPGAVVAYECAAELHGWDLLRGPGAAQLIVPVGSRGAYRTVLSPDEVVLVGPFLTTSPTRTALDIACRSPRIEAVVALDSALRVRSVSMRRLEQTFAVSRRRGVSTGRMVLALADPHSGSVAETEARLLFLRAGLPPPVSQLPIIVDGRLVARADFGWDFALLVVEIDGFNSHSRFDAFQEDLTRQNRVSLGGWMVLRFTVWDVRLRPEFVASQIRQALNRPL
jgi:hypothetical protein